MNIGYVQVSIKIYAALNARGVYNFILEMEIIPFQITGGSRDVQFFNVNLII